MSVVLMGLNQNHYNIIRNLDEDRFDIHVFARPNSIAKSRKRFTLYSVDGNGGREGLMKRLIEFLNQKDGVKIIIPATDGEILLTERLRSEGHDAVFCLSRSDVLASVCNKYTLQGVLREHGIRYPHSTLIDAEPEAPIDGLRYPCILKPVFSNEWKTARSSRILGENKALIVRSFDDLRSTYERVRSVSRQVIAQEIICQKGNENYSFCSYSDPQGSVLHGFVTQKLIQYPDRFGTALLCQTIDHPRVAAYGARVVQALALDGIAETEIIVDAETDELCVIEVNPRHWMQHRLSTRLGVNYTLLDVYSRLRMQGEAQALLSRPSPEKHVVWFDEVGYLIYAAKQGFHPGKCFFHEIRPRAREYSLLSRQDCLPFLHTLRSKLDLGH